MSLFDGAFIPVNCPKCGYTTDVELQSIRLHRTVFCSCCKVRIQLVDSDASLHRAEKEIDSAIKDLQREFKKLNRTITLRL